MCWRISRINRNRLFGDTKTSLLRFYFGHKRWKRLHADLMRRSNPVVLTSIKWTRAVLRNEPVRIETVPFFPFLSDETDDSARYYGPPTRSVCTRLGSARFLAKTESEHTGSVDAIFSITQQISEKRARRRKELEGQRCFQPESTGCVLTHARTHASAHKGQRLYSMTAEDTLVHAHTV